MLIAHLSDWHIRPLGLPANRVVETNAMAARVLRSLAVAEPAVDAVVITGDLTECGRVEEYAEVRRLLAGWVRAPVYMVPGNHDRRDNFRAALADWPGVSTDPGFVQYAADIGPIRLIMLDSVVPGAGYGALCAGRLDFLERALADAVGRPTLIGLHHPPFMTGIAAMDAIPLRNPEDLLRLAARHGTVLAILGGHHHRALIGQHGGTMLLAAPAVGGHQSELTYDPAARAYFHLEAPGYFMLRYHAVQGLSAAVATVGDFPGPFPFSVEPDYPGRPGR